jgi:signal transduction histidine kinase
MKNIIDKLKTANRIRVGYGTAFFLLLFSYLITLFANRELLKQAERVDHTNKIISHLDGLISYMKDAETGYRGYLLVKDINFLSPYYKSLRLTDSTFSLLKAETTDPVQQERLARIRALIDRKLSGISNGMTLFNDAGRTFTDSVEKLQYRGKTIMDDLRIAVLLMQKTEKTLLEKRTANMKSSFSALNAIIIVSLVIAFLLLIFGFLTYIRENKARREADDQVRAYQDQLQKRVEELAVANKELLQMRSQEKFASTGRIARTIAHEVRNPLTNINLAMEQLRTDMPVVDENAHYLFDMMSRNSNRINQLISDLLSSTKFAELKQEKVSANTLLEETLEWAGDRIDLNNISIEKKYDKNLCNVFADKGKLKIAFLNIIVNAIEAMEPGKGILRITTKAEVGKCIIEISDNGHGMDKESLAKLFEPYFTNKPNGNGLGLTNTQNIILNHKGTISVVSERGKGATFTILLDLVNNQ